MESFYFLCGNFDKNNFIYAIKNDLNDWHYFEEQDTLFDVHVSLPRNLLNEISRLQKVKSIPMQLNAAQIADYMNDGKFVFKEKELKTCKEL